MKTSLPPEIIRGWHLIGPGPARYGYAWRHPCGLEWLGRTKAEALARIAKGPLS